MIERELKKLKEETNNIVKYLAYSEDKEASLYRLNLLRSKIRTIQNLNDYPRYSELVQMDDQKLEEEKQIFLEELSLKEDLIEEEKLVLRLKIKDLEKREKELLKNLEDESFQDRKAALIEWLKLQVEQIEYISEEPWSLKAELDKKQNFYQKEKERILALNLEDFREELLDEIPKRQIIESVLKRKENDDYKLFLGFSNFKETLHLATLLSEYFKLNTPHSKKTNINLVDGLDEEFVEFLLSNDKYYDTYWGRVIINDDIIAETSKYSGPIMESFKESLLLAKKDYEEKETNRKQLQTKKHQAIKDFLAQDIQTENLKYFNQSIESNISVLIMFESLAYRNNLIDEIDSKYKKDKGYRKTLTD